MVRGTRGPALGGLSHATGLSLPRGPLRSCQRERLGDGTMCGLHGPPEGYARAGHVTAGGGEGAVSLHLLRAVCPLCSVLGVSLHKGERAQSLHLLRAVRPLCSVVGVLLHEGRGHGLCTS